MKQFKKVTAIPKLETLEDSIKLGNLFIACQLLIVQVLGTDQCNLLLVCDVTHVLHVRQETLSLEVVHKHHQVSVARQVPATLSRETIGLQEEKPEVGQGQELLLVQEQIGV